MNGLLLGMMVGAFAGFVAGGITMAVLAAARREEPEVPRTAELIAERKVNLWLAQKCSELDAKRPVSSDPDAADTWTSRAGWLSAAREATR
jgi:hypothetical protein